MQSSRQGKRGIPQSMTELKVKGKGKSEHLYSALHGTNHYKVLRHESHNFKPAKNTMPAFTS